MALNNYYNENYDLIHEFCNCFFDVFVFEQYIYCIPVFNGTNQRVGRGHFILMVLRDHKAD